MDRQYCVYIITNKNNSVLYTGVTGDLKRRIFEHKAKLVQGFSKRYNLDKLVYYELTSSVESAINREKQLKGGSRRKKMELITGMNPGWTDLYQGL